MRPEYVEKLANICCDKFKDFSDFFTIVGKFEDVQLAVKFYDLIFLASAFH